MNRIAYVPLNTYPEAVSDAAVLAAVRLAGTLGYGAEVATFAVQVPPVASPLGGLLVSVEGLARATEDRSKAECDRLRSMVEASLGQTVALRFTHHKSVLGTASEAAKVEARYCDLVLVPWSSDVMSVQDTAQALVFGSGLPVILVPPSGEIAQLDHIAVAWDQSRVAARALGDALRLLAKGGRVTVITVEDEKALGQDDIAGALVTALEGRGYRAGAAKVRLAGRTIGAALQETAMAEGCQTLAMGGFGHSRLREFVLGGATNDVLGDLRMPVLMAH